MNSLTYDRRTLSIILAAAIGLLAGLYLGSFGRDKPGVSRADWPAAHENPRSLGH